MPNAKRDVACTLLIACTVITVAGVYAGYDGAVVLSFIGAVIAGARVLMLGKDEKHETPPLTDPVSTVLEITGPGWEWDRQNGGLRPK